MVVPCVTAGYRDGLIPTRPHCGAVAAMAHLRVVPPGTQHRAAANGPDLQTGETDMATKPKGRYIRVERDWLGTTVPNALEMIRKGLDQPAWYADTFGLTPQKALDNVIACLREQARV